jgi:hypothetical protein
MRYMVDDPDTFATTGAADTDAVIAAIERRAARRHDQPQLVTVDGESIGVGR